MTEGAAAGQGASRGTAGTGSAEAGEAGSGAAGCDTHAGVGAELRVLALTALDRLEPALQRLRADPPTADPPTAGSPTAEPRTGQAASCAGCPVCAVLALLRGERPELAVALAEQLGGLLAVLRTALREGDPAADGPAAEPPGRPEGPARRVHRIRVDRVAPPC